MRYCFLGSSDFAIPTLDRLCQINTPLCVITQPDKPKGRGRLLSATPLGDYAANQRQKPLTVHKPETLATLIEIINQYKPDIIIVVAYGRLIPAAITDRYFCVNIHPSLLPKYRGATPIQAALLNQDTVSGITLIRMITDLDAGDILSQVSYAIPRTSTWGDLNSDYAQKAADLCVDYMTAWRSGNTQAPRPQRNHEATFCHKLSPEDSLLRPDDTVAVNLAKIRALSPKPGAYTIQNNHRIKILNANIQDGHIIPTVIQPAGRRVMAYSDYLRGSHATEISL